MRADRGFTLFEVLVALAIASLALGVLFSGAASGLRGTDTAGRYQEAVARARSHLAALAVPGRLVVSDRQGDDGGGYHWRERIVALGSWASASPAGTTPVPPGVTLYAVEVVISWSGREVRLESQRLGTSAAAQRL